MFPQVLRDGSISNAKSTQVIQQILQVRRVGVAVGSTIWVRLHVDVIPGDAVVPARGDTLAHGEHQPLSPGHVDPVQSLLPLR